MRSPRAATMIALASVTGHARTLPASRTGAGEMMPCSMHFLMLSVLRGFAVRLRPRHAATSPGCEECPEQADVRVVALMAKTALSSAYSAGSTTPQVGVGHAMLSALVPRRRAGSAVLHAWLLLGGGDALRTDLARLRAWRGLVIIGPLINALWAPLSQIGSKKPFLVQAGAYPAEHG
jgi:hypothetical protein